MLSPLARSCGQRTGAATHRRDGFSSVATRRARGCAAARLMPRHARAALAGEVSAATPTSLASRARTRPRASYVQNIGGEETWRYAVDTGSRCGRQASRARKAAPERSKEQHPHSPWRRPVAGDTGGTRASAAARVRYRDIPTRCTSLDRRVATLRLPHFLALQISAKRK